ncbi:MAG: BON domain-containing protein [Nitrospiraceae bacterium]|nr:BON domain-containing protein [Nitrospiraceae bacterium]
MCHLCLHSPTRTQVSRVVVTFLTVMLTFWPIASACAEQGQHMVMEAEMILAIEDRLAGDEFVQENLIDVVSEKGIVTLLGEVDNILAKERAAALTAPIKGVRSVMNQLLVNPLSSLEDQDIEDHVQSALLENPATELYDMSMKVTDGRGTLTGTVQSWQEKQLALQVAKGVEGTKAIQDQLEVLTVKNRSDKAVQQEILQRLHHDVWVDSSPVMITVRDRRVTVAGTVRSVDEKSRIISLAWVDGITSVNGEQLQVEWSAREPMRRSGFHIASDETIQYAIYDALSYDPRITNADITIEVKEGLVTLTGIVDNLQAKTTAEENTWNTTGVYNVMNLIKVRTKQNYSNKDIATRAKAVFRHDPLLNHKTINVSVSNRTIALRGTVKSRSQKSRAGLLAARVKGATTVDNRLKYAIEWQDKSDPELRQDIEDQFWWSPFLSDHSISVRVEDGVATLKGSVRSWQQRSLAAEHAFVAGARFGHNRLQVDPS